MDHVYIVVENGDPYPVAYKTFFDATNAIREKYKEEIELEQRWCEENAGLHGCNDVDGPENLNGTTYYYIEKGIHIYICKLPVV
jgi:hypothetical protein